MTNKINLVPHFCIRPKSLCLFAFFEFNWESNLWTKFHFSRQKILSDFLIKDVTFFPLKLVTTHYAHGVARIDDFRFSIINRNAFFDLLVWIKKYVGDWGGPASHTLHIFSGILYTKETNAGGLECNILESFVIRGWYYNMWKPSLHVLL